MASRQVCRAAKPTEALDGGLNQYATSTHFAEAFDDTAY